MNFRSIIVLFCVAFVFFGCETKRKYFEPEEYKSKVSYDGTLPAEIVDLTRDGATLANGQYITKNGLDSFVLPKGFRFFGEYANHIIAGDDSGVLHVYDENKNLLYENKFSSAIASASLNGGDLAIIDASNRLSIISMRDNSVKFTLKQDDVYALDARIAAPFFLTTLVLFPTLDGKIIIVDRDANQVVRDFVLSSEQFFNNPIYINAIGDRMVVATADRIISIVPGRTTFYDDEIKDVLALDDRVYVFTKDGRVVWLNNDLNLVKEEKFQFAFFSGVSENGLLHVVEKNGYLIVLDKDLNYTQIYKLPDVIEHMTFVTKRNLYTGNKIFTFGSL